MANLRLTELENEIFQRYVSELAADPALRRAHRTFSFRSSRLRRLLRCAIYGAWVGAAACGLAMAGLLMIAGPGHGRAAARMISKGD